MAEFKALVRNKKVYRIYIDESGDHTYHSLADHGKRYFGLTGCIVESEYYRTTFHPTFGALKQNHFPHNPDEPVILHRRDIVYRKGSFWRLRDAQLRETFDNDILKFMSETSYVLITIVIDKKAHLERHREAAFHPYHYCLAALLERYCGFLNFYNAAGDVMAESRQGKDDNKLCAAYKGIYEGGTAWRGTDFFQKGLSSSELKLKPKTANISGLQLADLLAYPSKQEILVGERRIERIGAFGIRI